MKGNQLNTDTESFHIGQYSDEYEEEEEIEDDYDLVTINLQHNYIFQLKYSQLIKYSNLILNEYLLNDAREHLSTKIQELESDKKIDEKNVIYFLKTFEGKKIKITNDRFRDLFKLSEFFQVKVLLKRLENFWQKHNEDVDFNITILLNEILLNGYDESDFSFNIEQSLINNIDKCIHNEKFKKLPVSIIHRILESSDRSKLTSDSLFNFIMKSLDTFYVLFSFLDVEKLSMENHHLMYQLKNENKAYYLDFLTLDIKYIERTEKLFNEIRQQKEENKTKDEIINNLNDEVKQLGEKNRRKEKEINDVKNDNEKKKKK